MKPYGTKLRHNTDSLKKKKHNLGENLVQNSLKHNAKNHGVSEEADLIDDEFAR